MLDKNKIKAIIFDVDGTLRDTDDEMVRSMELFLLKFEYFISSKKAQTMARKFVMKMENPTQKVLYYSDKWGWDNFIHQSVLSLRRLFSPIKHNDNYLSIEGVQGMIPLLAQKYPLAIASAGNRETVLAFLEHAGIQQYFTAIATALTCPHTKPFADPLIWAANEMHVLPEECLMVGDTTVDVLAGKNAGTQTLAVLCGFGEQSELEALHPDCILNSTAEMLDLVL